MVLRDAGKLPVGSVTSVRSRRADAFNSQTEFLRPVYSPEVSFADKASAPPTRLLLKRNKPDEYSTEACALEVRFYKKIAELKDHPALIPACYAAETDTASRASFILMRDLSETHMAPMTREQVIAMPENLLTQAQMNAAIDTLAVFHAHWWNQPALSQGDFTVGHWSRDPERFREYLAKRIAAWQRLASTEGARLPLKVHAFYDQLFNRLPRFFSHTLLPRFSTMHNLSLIHGDAYFNNFLCPMIPNSAPAYLVDWQSVSCDIPAYDLVNLLATFWSRAFRQENARESTLLERYHHGLETHGVANYSMDDLLNDYRNALMYWVLVPIQDGADGADYSYWWPKMKCLMAAFDDWDC